MSGKPHLQGIGWSTALSSNCANHLVAGNGRCPLCMEQRILQLQSDLATAKQQLSDLKLKWATGRPKSKGKYWVRFCGYAYIARFVTTEDEAIFEALEENTTCGYEKCKWAGPITPPTEEGEGDE